MKLEELLRTLLPAGVVVLLRNEAGTMELRGDDLELKSSERWLTVYHAGALADGSSETRSHLHLRRNSFGNARVVERAAHTPTLEFWPKEEDARQGGRPPLSVTFPSFYDWQNDKAPIAKNRKWFDDWVERYGRRFELESS